MKKIILISFLVPAFLFSCEKNNDTSDNTETILMGDNHMYDVYYSFLQGEVASYDRSDWDIAFSVPLQTATILINEGAGVQLYSFGDTTSWDVVDTAGLSFRIPAFNDKSDWMNGAFNRFSEGGFNFGWGTYDHANTYAVWGDSIYVIRLTNGEIKKLFIRKRDGYTDTYEMRWANIDGSDQTDASFSPAPYSDSKHFIQYSIVNKEVVEAQPDKDTWDILFTKYVVKIPYGQGVYIDYPVVGVLLRPGIEGLKVEAVNPENAHHTDASGDFTDQADVIGWDWKSSDPITHEISLADSTCFFVKVSASEIYRIYFTEYDSQSEGKISFKVKKVE